MAAPPPSELTVGRAGRSLTAKRWLSRRRALGALAAAAAAAAMWRPRPSAADPAGGEIYYTRFSGTPNLKKVSFHFDGLTLRFDSRTALARLDGADGLIFVPDGDLIVSGQGYRVHKVKLDGSGVHATRDAGGEVAFHVALDPRGDRVWTSGQPGALVEIPLAPFGAGIVRELRGEDTVVTGIGFDNRGTAYYTASNFRGGGSFGTVDLATFTTTRLMSDILAAHAITFDSFSGDLFLFGGDEIVQIAPESPRAIKSSKRFALTGHFDQGTTDGRGHLFVAHNTGRVVFVDYAASRRIADEGNVIAIAFLDCNLDDLAPMSGPGARPEAPPPPEPPAEDPPPAAETPEPTTAPAPEAGGQGPEIGLPQGLAAAAAVALAAVLAWMGYLVFGRKRTGDGPRPGASAPPPSTGWQEDWSAAKTLAEGILGDGIDDLGAHLRANPDTARKAAAAVKVLVEEASQRASDDPDGAAAALREAATRYRDDDQLARFAEILASFAGGARHVTSRVDAAEGGTRIRVVHEMDEQATPSWARVEVTASTADDEVGDGRNREALRAVERSRCRAAHRRRSARLDGAACGRGRRRQRKHARLRRRAAVRR